MTVNVELIAQAVHEVAPGLAIVLAAAAWRCQPEPDPSISLPLV